MTKRLVEVFQGDVPAEGVDVVLDTSGFNSGFLYAVFPGAVSGDNFIVSVMPINPITGEAVNGLAQWPSFLNPPLTMDMFVPFASSPPVRSYRSLPAPLPDLSYRIRIRTSNNAPMEGVAVAFVGDDGSVPSEPGNFAVSLTGTVEKE